MKKEYLDNQIVILHCIQKIKGDYFTETEHLISEGWLDSFEILRLAQELERAFGVKIPLESISPEEFESFMTIEELILNNS